MFASTLQHANILQNTIGTALQHAKNHSKHPINRIATSLGPPTTPCIVGTCFACG